MHNTPDMLVANSLHEPRGPDAQIRVLNTANEPLILQPRRKAVTKSTTVEVVEASENGLGGEHFSSHLDERMPIWKQNLTVEDISGVNRPIPCLHQAMFSADKYDAVHTNSTRHIIPALEGTQPTKQRPYRHSPIQENEIENRLRSRSTTLLKKASEPSCGQNTLGRMTLQRVCSVRLMK